MNRIPIYFQDFSVPKFLEWAKEAKEPLRTYSCGIYYLPSLFTFK